MIKIKRSPNPPESLAIEAAKSYGSYREPDVVRQLKKDFHDKCYICGLQELSDPEVEHLLPHKNRTIKERVFDWNNLFYACPHCNGIKNNTKYDEKIINCCEEEPELYLDHIFVNGHVQVHNTTAELKSIMTADLIENCFEKTSTGIREAACQHRVNKLSTTMNILYKTLKKYKDNPNSDRYKETLQYMLSRESSFAAFKRYYVRTHIEEYPDLKSFVSLTEAV